jgi:hypothetical protein
MFCGACADLYRICCTGADEKIGASNLWWTGDSAVTFLCIPGIWEYLCVLQIRITIHVQEQFYDSYSESAKPVINDAYLKLLVKVSSFDVDDSISINDHSALFLLQALSDSFR